MCSGKKDNDVRDSIPAARVTRDPPPTSRLNRSGARAPQVPSSDSEIKKHARYIETFIEQQIVTYYNPTDEPTRNTLQYQVGLQVIELTDYPYDILEGISAPSAT